MAGKHTDRQQLTIGQMAARTGLSVSAIRFYEEKGLLSPSRNPAGHRRYRRSDIRRLSFVLIAQQLGLGIKEISAALGGLPDGRTPTPRDWARISRGIKARIDQRIDTLSKTRERLDGCIGCGCLSLAKCQLYNADDHQASGGPGPAVLR